MAESSVLAFVYVMLIGIALSITLFVIRKYSKKEKLILNKCTELHKTMTFSKSNLLQLNATVIAGLFILLTLQNITSGGIPQLLDFRVTMDELELYNDTMNDPDQIQAIKDEAEKRYAETKLDFDKRQIQFDMYEKAKPMMILLHPISYLLISLGLFIISCLIALASRIEDGRAFRVSEGFTISGFLFMGVAVYIILVFPRF